MSTFLRGLCFLIAGGLSAATFSDTTFNPADYSTQIWNPQAIAIGISQINPGGNPGDAIQFLYSWNGATDFDSRIGMINNSWSYDPATEGAITSVDFSMDRYVGLIGIPDPGISNGGEILAEQNGLFYVAFMPAGDVVGSYLGISATALQNTDFGLVSFITGDLDFSQNPDFESSGPPLLFGLATRTAWTDTIGGAIDLRHDNLIINVNSAPEPSSAVMLLIAGGVWLAALFRKKITQR